jgi:coproporphyrinogen III oxidase-like Fe-S oxidoreductase
MFGQTAGIGSTSISKSNNMNVSKKTNDTDTYVRNLDTSNKKIINVVYFEKEKKSEDKNLDKKIKIKTF